MRITGKYESVGELKSFIPASLPPTEPNLQLDAETTKLYGEVMLHLGKLDGVINTLPDLNRFINAYLSKEAMLTSSIEGIHTTLFDIFTQPLLETKPNKDLQLVLNYKKALDKAIELINSGLPISSRVILASHEELLSLDGNASPGNYRKQMVKVGNLIPAPPQEITGLMAQLENYINDDADNLPFLIKVGLTHVQFETIHPFLDGNGRIGRLLITLMLVESGFLSQPILYPSYYFKKHVKEYYSRLDAVRTQGDFEGWIKYYLKMIKLSSIDAYMRAKDLENLWADLDQLINTSYPKKSYALIRCRALLAIFSYPVININQMSAEVGVSYNAAAKIITDFIDLGILIHQTYQKRGKLYKFKRYFDILEKGYDLE